MSKEKEKQPDKQRRTGGCGDLPDVDIPLPDALGDGDMGGCGHEPFDDIGFGSGCPSPERQDI